MLNYLREQPKATQKEIAAHIVKSERTVKTTTVHLVEKGIIERRNGKQVRFWEIKTNEPKSQNSCRDIPDVAAKLAKLSK